MEPQGSLEVHGTLLRPGGRQDTSRSQKLRYIYIYIYIYITTLRKPKKGFFGLFDPKPSKNETFELSKSDSRNPRFFIPSLLGPFFAFSENPSVST